jgi:two-component system, cell cycle response regulator DivK
MPKVLLVEDNELNLDMLSRRLQKRGYDVVVAVDGAQACDKASREVPDLILMDIGLPDFDGFEATRRIREDTATARIPIIALTAQAMDGDREKALAAGCDEHETKPVNLQHLLAKMESLLPGDAKK